jgi:hypothetical protein
MDVDGDDDLRLRQRLLDTLGPHLVYEHRVGSIAPLVVHPAIWQTGLPVQRLEDT